MLESEVAKFQDGAWMKKLLFTCKLVVNELLSRNVMM